MVRSGEGIAPATDQAGDVHSDPTAPRLLPACGPGPRSLATPAGHAECRAAQG